MITTEIGFTYFPSTNSFTIYKTSIIEENGIIGTSGDTRAFTCDMLDDMKAYINDDSNPVIAHAEAMWTPEVVASFKTAQLAAEE